MRLVFLVVLRISIYNLGKHYQKQKSLERADYLLFLCPLLPFSFIPNSFIPASLFPLHPILSRSPSDQISVLISFAQPSNIWQVWWLSLSWNILFTWRLSNSTLSPTCFLCYLCWFLCFFPSSQLASLTPWPASLSTPTIWVISFRLVALQ